MTVDYGHSFSVESARREEWTEAFSILFQRLTAAEQRQRVENALALVRRGELPPGGVFVARRGEQVLGAILCLPIAGAGGLIWPPQVKPLAERIAVEDRLVQCASSWLRAQGAKVAQALLTPEEVPMAPPLERNGFEHITTLQYLRHDVRTAPAFSEPAKSLCYVTYAERSVPVFHRALLETYKGSLDCPEVNGIRSISEIIAGHQAQGTHEPDRWFLALNDEQPAGVLLLTEIPESGSMEISYLGVLPQTRGVGASAVSW